MQCSLAVAQCVVFVLRAVLLPLALILALGHSPQAQVRPTPEESVAIASLKKASEDLAKALRPDQPQSGELSGQVRDTAKVLAGSVRAGRADAALTEVTTWLGSALQIINTLCPPGQPCDDAVVAAASSKVGELAEAVWSPASKTQQRAQLLALSGLLRTKLAFSSLYDAKLIDELNNLLKVLAEQPAKAIEDSGLDGVILKAWIINLQIALKATCPTDCPDVVMAAALDDITNLVSVLPNPRAITQKRAIVGVLADKLKTMLSSADIYNDVVHTKLSSVLQAYAKNDVSRYRTLKEFLDHLKTVMNFTAGGPPTDDTRLRLNKVNDEALVKLVDTVAIELKKVANAPPPAAPGILILDAWSGDLEILLRRAARRTLPSPASAAQRTDRFCISTRTARNTCMGRESCSVGTVGELCGYDPVPHADPSIKGTLVYFECLTADAPVWNMLMASHDGGYTGNLGRTGQRQAAVLFGASTTLSCTAPLNGAAVQKSGATAAKTTENQ